MYVTRRLSYGLRTPPIFFLFLPPSSFMMLDTTTTTGVVDVGGYKRPPSVVSAVSSTFLYYLTTTIRPVLYGPFLRLDYLVNFVLVVLSIPLSLNLTGYYRQGLHFDTFNESSLL